jgi:hypothetical protein
MYARRVSKRRHEEPDRSAPRHAASQHVSAADVDAAITRFVQTFVVRTKRERALIYLLDPTRRETGVHDVCR